MTQFVTFPLIFIVWNIIVIIIIIITSHFLFKWLSIYYTVSHFLPQKSIVDSWYLLFTKGGVTFFKLIVQKFTYWSILQLCKKEKERYVDDTDEFIWKNFCCFGAQSDHES